MEETVLIYSMALLITIAAACSIILSRVHMPALIGFLITGIVFANYFELSVEFEEVIEVFSNLGLIMLMFAIGMEIDVRKIKEKGLFAMIVACVQLPLMLFGGMLGGMLMGFNLVQCIALGALISGSSTAVVTAVLKAQGTLDREHIEMLVLITIMEDIGQVVILSIITPVLQGGQMNGQDLMMLILNIAFFMSMCFVVGLRVVPRIIDWLSDRISDELTAILCVGLAFGLAYTANKLGLSVAIALAMGVSMLRVLTGLSLLYFLIPGYVLSLGLSFIVPDMYTAIAFDAGGVASGPMTAAFMLQFMIGASSALGGNVLSDAFGIVAMVAMMPLITIQLLGVRAAIAEKRMAKQTEVYGEADIIELWEVAQ